MESPHATRPPLIEPTSARWHPRLRCPLTDEDARPRTEPVTGFFAILAEWSRAAPPAPANAPPVAAPLETAEVRHDR